MNKLQNQAELPLGQTARLTLELDALRYECCKRTRLLLETDPSNELELGYVTLLHDSLRNAHRILDQVTLEILTDMQQRKT